jgi:hypothetical protein
MVGVIPRNFFSKIGRHLLNMKRDFTFSIDIEKWKGFYAY